MAETQKIGWVKFWTPKDDWYYLDKKERERYLEAFEQAANDARKAGAQLVGVYKCRGQSEWMRFEVWEFPSLEQIVDFTHSLEAIGHYQYFEEDNTVGRKYERTGSKSSWVI